MTAEPVKLKTVAPEAKCNASSIEMLEDALAKARAGEIQEIAMCLFKPDGNYLIYISPTVSSLKKIGAFEVIKSDLIKQIEIK